MFKKALVSVALLALASSNAFADDVTDYANDLLSAQAEIAAMVSGASVAVPSTPDSGVTTPDTGSSSGAVGGWHFDNDAIALPFYDSSSLALGEGANKLLESQFLTTVGQFAAGAVKKSEGCAEVNIALLDLSTANRYAALPGGSQILAPFGSQMLRLFDKIKEGRVRICR